MEKLGSKKRDIQFYSGKNGQIVRVHSSQARDYTKYLEEQGHIGSYEANYPLDISRYVHVSRTGIRTAYFETEWASDFLLRYADGRTGVRELVTQEQLQKRAVLEKLEFSRRYWAALDVADWKVVLVP